MELWAKGEFGVLEAKLSNLDKPMKTHEYKVKNRLDEAYREAGIEKKKKGYQKSSKSFLSQSGEKVSIRDALISQPANGPEPILHGSMVWAKSTSTGMFSQVDSSHIGKGYIEVDESEVPEKYKTQS